MTIQDDQPDKTPPAKEPFKMNRRRFLQIGSLAVAGGVLATTYYFSRYDEASTPVVEQVVLPIKNLHAALDGFSIAVLADFHLYPLTQKPLIETAVAMTNDLKPDLTVMLGDYVWHDVEAIFDLAPILGQLNARHGVYAAIGNHDIWTDIHAIRQGMADANIPILENEGLPITDGNGTFYLAGLDDGWSGTPDLQTTLKNDPGGVPIVTLMHEPDVADDYADNPRIALQISGHTHGGQIRVPGVGAPVLPYLGRKYDMGLFQVNDMWVYTNRGIGVTNEPVRINCPPEVTQIILTAV